MKTPARNNGQYSCCVFSEGGECLPRVYLRNYGVNKNLRLVYVVSPVLLALRRCCLALGLLTTIQ